MAISRNGKELSRQAQAAYIRDITGWTRETYKKKYDVFYNRARTYEKLTGDKLDQPISDIFAREIRSQIMDKRYGVLHESSAIYHAITSAPAASTGRGVETFSKKKRSVVQIIALAALEKHYAGVLAGKYGAAARAALAETTDVAKSREILETFAKKIKLERDQIAAYNKSVTDPFLKIRFKS